MMESERHTNGKMSKEIRYSIYSIKADANVLPSSMKPLEYREAVILGTWC